MIKNRKNRKGFTLIELLVVIAIIAILAVVVVLTLNPAELLRQARDSNRLSDFATIKSALSLYATDVATTTPMYGTDYRLYSSDSAATTPPTPSSTLYETTSTWGFLGNEKALANATSNSRAIDGTGWIPLNLNAVSSGAPMGSLPIDPTNSGQQMYLYAASSTIFKVATQMESVKYKAGGTGDVSTNDGGNSVGTYEQGTNLTSL